VRALHRVHLAVFCLPLPLLLLQTENAKNLQSDEWRLYQLLKSTGIVPLQTGAPTRVIMPHEVITNARNARSWQPTRHTRSTSLAPVTLPRCSRGPRRTTWTSGT
jgi:hypothetical protein